MKSFVLDSSSIIAYLNDEKGAEKVENLLDEASNLDCNLIMHNASVAEVFYDTIHRSSEQEGLKILNMVSTFPVTFIDTISTDLIKWIGYFKTSYKLSFADTFVLATAKLNNAKVVTSDHHEFDEVERRGDAQFEWIR